MPRLFKSPIFGRTRDATEEEKAEIQELLKKVPVEVFQQLNKLLNVKGMCLKFEMLGTRIYLNGEGGKYAKGDKDGGEQSGLEGGAGEKA